MPAPTPPMTRNFRGASSCNKMIKVNFSDKETKLSIITGFMKFQTEQFLTDCSMLWPPRSGSLQLGMYPTLSVKMQLLFWRWKNDKNNATKYRLREIEKSTILTLGRLCFVKDWQLTVWYIVNAKIFDLIWGTIVVPFATYDNNMIESTALLLTAVKLWQSCQL